MILPVITALISAAPALVGLFDSDDESTVSKVARSAADVAKAVTGKDTEADALAALEADPALMIEYQRITAEKAVALYQEETKRLQSVNATMRVEAKSDKWWVSGWRPFWGFCSAIAFMVVTALCCWLAYEAIAKGRAEALTMIPQLVGAMATLFAIPGAILGVASWHRGKEKRIKAGETAGPGLLKKVAGAFKG